MIAIRLMHIFNILIQCHPMIHLTYLDFIHLLMLNLGVIKPMKFSRRLLIFNLKKALLEE